jgi:hypothetical protein
MTADNTTPDTDVLDASDEVDTPEVAGSKTFDVDVVLNDLEMMANNFSDHVQGLRLMQENGFFKYASKECRNELLDGMLAKVDTLDETTKVAFRALKRVKRERVPDHLVDTLLIVSSAGTPGRL